MMLLFQEFMIGRQFMGNPFRKPMPHIRECHQIRWQRSDLLVVNQQTVCIFNLEVMRIARLKFHNAAPGRIVHDHSERFTQKPGFVLQLFRHFSARWHRLCRINSLNYNAEIPSGGFSAHGSRLSMRQANSWTRPLAGTYLLSSCIIAGLISRSRVPLRQSRPLTETQPLSIA